MADLIALAREQSERCSPPVRAAAWMRIARVEMVTDAGQARRTFERGLEETRRLPGQEGEFLMDQARLLAAAVAPDLIADIPSPRHGAHPFWPERLGRVMLEHGHGDAAFDYVMRHREPPTFPFPLVSALIDWYGDDRRLTLLRRAFSVWLKAPEMRFLWLFQAHWKVLPAAEAAEVAREIVRVTLARPDQPSTARYGPGGELEITSSRQNTLFLMLSVLRRLDGPLAESLIAHHPQLAAAARRYPNGTESIMEEAQALRNAGTAEVCGGSLGVAGSTSDLPYLQALLQASRDGEFDAPLQFALDRYEDDVAPGNPNQVPREFWPSTCNFRGVLYHAGLRLGEDAARYLDRIPDPDLRLFAQIELAAALAGLPELQGTQMEQHRRPGSWTRRR